ncbi:MAG: hypothetical protein QN131_15615 [Armatimonadota bacterium]|nr:hypothetical protein [Armatimonadota bacterium]
MRVRSVPHETGAALVIVILVMVILAAIGAFALLAIDRNTEMQAGYTKSVAGFYAAEAGLNRGAADTRNTFLNFEVPTDCNPRTLAINQRNVNYQLEGCGQSPVVVPVPQGEPFEGLNSIRYVYNLRSEAVNAAGGHTEAILRLRFETRLIPMFQLAAFYLEDLELTVGPPMVINGRMHTNGNMYLNTESCSPGAQILGQVTVVGDLYRGRKDDLTYSNSGLVWIANPDNTLRILGRTGPGDTSCAVITTRLVPDSEIALWNGRIRNNLENVAIPGQDELLCAPWSCPPGQTRQSTFWQRADLRIVLNTLRTEKLDPDNPAAPGPALYALEVYDASGSVNAALTTRLRRFVRDVPGGITYSDVPRNPACVEGASCEGNYRDSDDYDTPFPQGGAGCQVRGPRDPINGRPVTDPASNYCNDFRYGGFYNWRERKPILMFNIDWRKLEEWNFRQPADQRLFNPTDTSDSGLVLYASVRGPASRDVNNYGVRIFNAQRLRRGSADPGVTFASDQAVYVMGNFNCRAPSVGSDSVPAACGSDGKKPAAVLGDTINVLSCDWIGGACSASIAHGVDEASGPPYPVYRPRDERSTTARPANKPSATETFINAGFLGGNDTTTCPGNPGGRDCQRDYYSGGLENYPRFHETWPQSARFWYEGSFVAVATPKHTCFTYNALNAPDDPRFSCLIYQLNGRRLQGYWRMQEIYGYSPPPRRWFYDVSFDNAANLPPLTPRAVTLRQDFFTEEFR